MALGGSLTQINLGVQGVTQGGHHRFHSNMLQPVQEVSSIVDFYKGGKEGTDSFFACVRCETCGEYLPSLPSLNPSISIPSMTSTLSSMFDVDGLPQGWGGWTFPGLQIFHKQIENHYSTFLFAANRQWSCYVERSPTLQRLRGKTSDTLFRSVADYPSFSTG
ncbi:hypothetical protein TNCV_1075641 [Trichonephila clavipes]|uniref:Uncharacterized protein n=1 Tax=Trichonephila clavipes TaxID=2585209 RepID=A0A8X6VQT1_TRICX|nr:hypothetical protein TNCV_1075641 [Trichonephila clavipes]